MQASDPKARKPYLDGLRGLSIIPVLLGHTFGYAAAPPPFDWLFSAHTGVRVFFVVSGFIITQLLLEERERTRSIRLGAFYGRRLAKLLPVLWLYLIVLALVGLTRDVSYSGGQLVAAAVLATGFFQTGTWYAGHVWSLTVEEVFYLTWAPGIRAWTQRRARAIALGTIACAVLVRGLNIAARSNHAAHLFTWWPHLPVIHELDAVAVGSVCALSVDALGRHRARSKSPGLLGHWIAGWTLTVVFGSQALQKLGPPQPLGWALGVLSPTLLAIGAAWVLIVASAQHANGGWTFLEWRPLTALGRASYSIYVVQQAFCIPAEWRTDSWFQRPPFNVPVAVAVGWLTFLLIEEPVRRTIVQARRWQRSA